MRIACSWLLQTRPHSQTGPALQTCLHPYLLTRRWRLYDPVRHVPLYRIASYATAQRRPYDDTSETFLPRSTEAKQGAKTRGKAHSSAKDVPSSTIAASIDVVIAHLTHRERQDPITWVHLLEKYIPQRMRRPSSTENSLEDSSHFAYTSNDLLTILNAARKRKNAGIDILAHMMINEKRKAALWICDFLLRKLASQMTSRSSDRPPSNIVWPQESFYKMTGRSIQVKAISHVSHDGCDTWDKATPDPRYSLAMSHGEERTMDQIWSTLGSVVIYAADMAGDDAQKALNAVQLVLGQIHNLDLIPDNVYAYQTPLYPATIQKTPIIHLLSSRILTALSDATWRDQQEENIEKAASHGLSYAEIGRDPPGGRFRLKVRPIDAEVWLEFILWCCVEGGFAGAGARIINQLQRDTTDPWFALTWTDSNGMGQITPRIDWARVKSRTGGTVGRLEGYSSVKPLAEIPSRTISTEVVLALVESHINTIRRVQDGNGMALEAAQNAIVNLISFLEPHDLPVPYFDYISVRLLQTEAFDMNRSSMLRKWSDRLAQLKSLKPAKQQPASQVSFQLDALLIHSEFAAGLLHQVLESFVQEGNIHDALRAFNDLQKLVDNSKLHAIGSFLQRVNSPDNFFGSYLFDGNPDFVDSHGQLPMYKIASLLNLATDTHLIGFGQWLLYNGDPDGPMIPKNAYGSSAVARALVRFAGLSEDLQLLESVSTQLNARRLQTVNFLRTSFNARISMGDYSGANEVMQQLNSAQGGGFGLSNLSHLAGAILRLEHRSIDSSSDNSDSRLLWATKLLDSMLGGQSYGPKGVLQKSIQSLFKQQVADLLKMFAVFPESSLVATARPYRHLFRAGNMPKLPTSVFNSFLEAVIDTKGAESGMKLVDLTCTHNAETWSLENALLSQSSQGQNTGLDVEADGPSDEAPSLGQSQEEFKGVLSQTFIPFLPSPTTDDGQDHSNPVDGEQTRINKATTSASPGLLSNRSSGQTTQEEPHFISPFFPAADQLPPQAPNSSDTGFESGFDSGTPASVYDARTIRLIVRKANKEYDEAKSKSKAEQDAALQVLNWSRLQFNKLGYTPNMISNEIRQSIVEAVDASPSLRKVFAKETKHSGHKRTSRIAKAFRGKPVTRTHIGY